MKEGDELVKSHFDFLLAFTQDSFTIHEEKTVLAQGELLSTALFHMLLSSMGKPAALLHALNFMCIDKDLEPDHFYIRENLERQLKENGKHNLFIT